MTPTQHFDGYSSEHLGPYAYCAWQERDIEHAEGLWRALYGKGRERDKTNARSRLPSSLTAGDLKSMAFQPLKWAVQGLVPEGLSLFVGKPKLGKSWLCLDLAVSVASGRITLGDIVCQQGDVLYLALEDSPRRLQRRLRKVLPGNVDWPPRLTFWTECHRVDDGGLERIREWISSHPEARLVIIDIFGKFRPERMRLAEQLYDRDYRAGQSLQLLATETGVAIIVVHHARKATADDPLDTISGTTGLAGVADCIMVLSRDGQGSTLEVRGRDVEEKSLAMSFSRESCKWTIQGSTIEVRRSDARKAVLAVLFAADEPMSDGDIALATDNKRTTIASLLRKMASDGEVHKIKRGRYVHPSRTDLMEGK